MRNRILETLLLIIIDALIIGVTFALAYYIRLGTFTHGQFEFDSYISMGMLMIPIWVLFLAFLGRYSLQDQSTWDRIKQVIIASFMASLLFPLMFYFKNDLFFSRAILALVCSIGSVLLLSVSWIFQNITLWRKKQNIGISRMLIIGANRSTQKIIRDINAHSSLHKPVAILSPYGAKVKEIDSVPVLGKLDALERVFTEYDINEVFLGEGGEHSENLASFCRNKGVPLRTSLETIGIMHPKIEVEYIGNTPFLTLQQSPLFGWGQFFKRVFDIIFASIGLILGLPVILINLKHLCTEDMQNGIDSTFKGWVLKKKGKIFSHKITLLWNVLKKDLSIVGPRLYTAKTYNIFFKEKKKQSESRFVLRQGIFSKKGKENTPESQLRTDILYIRNWNFWEDAKILVGI